MSERKKKTLLILCVIAGLILQFVGMLAGSEHMRTVSIICILAGCMLFSLSGNKLERMHYEKEFPEAVRQEQIERMDERNILIRSRAKAKTSDISRWAVIGLSGINYLLNGPLWMTLTPALIFALIYILEWYYIDKYQKNM